MRVIERDVRSDGETPRCLHRASVVWTIIAVYERVPLGTCFCVPLPALANVEIASEESHRPGHDVHDLDFASEQPLHAVEAFFERATTHRSPHATLRHRPVPQCTCSSAPER